MRSLSIVAAVVVVAAVRCHERNNDTAGLTEDKVRVRLAGVAGVPAIKASTLCVAM